MVMRSVLVRRHAERSLGRRRGHKNRRERSERGGLHRQEEDGQAVWQLGRGTRWTSGGITARLHAGYMENGSTRP